MLSATNLDHVRELNLIAAERGQTLAQMAVAWLLKDERVSSVLVGASRPSQLEDSVRGVENTTFTTDELARINLYAKDGGLNIWAGSSNA